MEIYYYRKLIFIIIIFKCHSHCKVERDSSANITLHACRPVFCLEMSFLRRSQWPRSPGVGLRLLAC